MNETTTPRPIGVTFVAFLYLTLAISALIIAARYVLFPSGNEDMILLFTRLKIPITFLNLLAVPPLITAGIATLLFRGLWQQRVWGWSATIFFSFLGMLASLLAIAFFVAFYFNTSTTMGAATGAFILFAWIFVYFLKVPPQPQPSPASAGPVVRPASGSQAPPARPEPLSAPLPSQGVHYETIHNAPTVALETEQGEETLLVAASPIACLVATQGTEAGKVYEICREDVLIGRHPTLADVLLTDPTVSAQHARLHYQDGVFWLIDLESTNGTFINDHRIHKAIVQDQDKIRLGSTTLIFTQRCSDD